MKTEIIIQVEGGRILNAMMAEETVEDLMKQSGDFVTIWHEKQKVLLNKNHIMIIRERVHRVA